MEQVDIAEWYKMITDKESQLQTSSISDDTQQQQQ